MSVAPPDPKPPSRFDRGLAIQWTAVFLANLPVLVLAALVETMGKGMVGLIAGLAVLYWVGLIVCAGRFRVGRSLIWGGIAVGASQVLPFLQYGAGTVGLSVWESATGCPLTVDLKGHNKFPERTAEYNLGVFVVVLLTAQPLWIIAILLGAFFRWLAGDTPIWSHPPADPDADPDPTENPAS